MRNLRSILLIVLMVVLSGACQRRPFAENRSKVSLNLSINTHIINHVQEELPENMRVDLYDPETAQLIYTDYVGPYGGYINPAPGVYEMIIYSLDLRECLQIGLIAFNPLKNRVSFFSIEIPTKILEKNPLIKIISQSISVFLTSIHRKKKNYLL